MMEDDDERAEFTRIYDTYGDAVFRRVLAILKNRQDAEDAVQEAWIRVAKNVRVLRGKEERTVCAYVMKVARNQAITLFRERARREEALCNTCEDGASCDDDLLSLCGEADIDGIRACFASLPEIYRDVLSLYFFYHHTVSEIASLINAKPATVNSRLTRGRKMLIALLKERGYHG